jgi:RNA polymerase sigma-70 factor (ECF subfamily)
MDRSGRIRDEILVLRAQAGEEGFEALVSRWQPALWRHAYRLTGDRESAWDVLQEAWCAIVRRLHRIEDPAAFPRWAFQVVTNKCRDWARGTRRRDRATTAYEEQVRNAPHRAGTTDDSLAVALARLDPELRVLVALYYEESFTVHEISEITGSPEGSVKSRLYRARQELRRHMEELRHEG